MSSSSSIISYDKPESCCCNAIPDTIHCSIHMWEPDPAIGYPSAIWAEHNLDLSICISDDGDCSGLFGPFPPICRGSTWAGSYIYYYYENITGIASRSSTAVLICGEYSSDFFIGGSYFGGEIIETVCPPQVNEVETSPGSPHVFGEMRCWW